MICFICRGRHLFLGDNNVTSRVFWIPVDLGLVGLVANVRPISVVCFLLDPYRVWFWVCVGVQYAGHQQWVGVQVGDVDCVLAAVVCH